ncbi:3-keto-disaccharide hydrolase [Marinoscillum furvescens]|uniref:Uncharacterized protein DUF1080 n=1 Tax=Marinoscillum furvescens DSM 4134 TaxID=1122208 RepID=A0A3D9L1U9_MARFU|nr:DUF1080 domain-containing protein [Marinoscillum furvescens]RED98343.1 uncharacterized protein DUF1080 [Marinoscillum furvescens DSM 4134]
MTKSICIKTLLSLLFCHLLFLSSAQFPVRADSEEGFKQIFNGYSLQGWFGDPEYWSVQDSCIVGIVTEDNLLEENSFLIYKDSLVGNLELKAEFRISPNGNSGINYHSQKVANKPYALKGYQADIDGANQWTGQNYEERGRTFLALRGQVTQISEKSKPLEIGSSGDKTDLSKLIKSNDWNEYHILVRGNTISHLINGQLMCVIIDDDDENRSTGGFLGVQVHVGPPMKIEYRNVRIKVN